MSNRKQARLPFRIPQQFEEVVPVVNIIEWDSDLVDTAAFLALLEFDAAFSSGITEAQADAMFTVAGGELEIDSAGATTAGADVDFVYRGFLTGYVLPQADADWRVEKGANHGLDFTAPLGFIRLAWLFFANAAAASPSTPADFAAYTDYWTGFEWHSWTAGNFGTSRGVWSSAPTNIIANLFQRCQARVNRALEVAGTNDTVVSFQAGANYASTTQTGNTTDSLRPISTKFDDARRVRFSIEINPDGLAVDLSDASLHRMHVHIPRMRLHLTPDVT